MIPWYDLNTGTPFTQAPYLVILDTTVHSHDGHITIWVVNIDSLHMTSKEIGYTFACPTHCTYCQQMASKQLQYSSHCTHYNKTRFSTAAYPYLSRNFSNKIHYIWITKWNICHVHLNLCQHSAFLSNLLG